MDIDDDMIRRMVRLEPRMLPICMIARGLRVLEGDERDRLVASIVRRKPRNDRDRRTLLTLSLATGVGGLLFVDLLGGFERQRPN